MASIVGDIAIQVGADIGPLVAQMARGEGSVSAFGAAASKAAGGGVSSLRLSSLALAGAVGAAAGGMALLVRSSINAAGALNDASKATGIHVASLQAMTQVAGEASVSQEQLLAALKKMEVNLAGLQSGAKAQTEAFGALGLSMQSLQGLSPDEAFTKIVEAINAIQDPAMKTAAAVDIFGKSGADLIPMMDGYAASLAEVAQKQAEFGIALSDDQAAKMDAAGDAAARLGMAVEGLGNQLAIALGPATTFVIEELSHAIQGWVAIFQDAKAALSATDLEAKFEATTKAAEEMAQAADMFAASTGDIAQGKLAQAFDLQAKNIRTATKALDDGAISAQEYKAIIVQATEKIITLLRTAAQVNGVDYNDAIASMAAFRDTIAQALGLANALANVKIGVKASADAGTGNLALVPDGATAETGVSAGSAAPATIRVNVGGGGHHGGGGSGGDGGALQADLKAMQERFASEAELVDQKYQDDLKKLEEFRNAKLVTQEQFDELELQATKEHHDKLAELDQQAMQSKLSAISGAFGDVASLMSVHNKAAFEIGKKAALAGAVVDGYASATAAWAKGMKIGGPPVAAAFTAASLAKTGAMIAGIQGTSFSGGSSGASASTGGSGVPTSPQSIANITLNGDSFSRQSVEDLFDQINQGVKQGRIINLVNA
jgi:hypothetical protein